MNITYKEFDALLRRLGFSRERVESKWLRYEHPDSELIIGLPASAEAEGGQARNPREHLGSIDRKEVRELVEEILEGGKEAFEMRRLKYNF